MGVQSMILSIIESMTWFMDNLCVRIAIKTFMIEFKLFNIHNFVNKRIFCNNNPKLALMAINLPKNT